MDLRELARGFALPGPPGVPQPWGTGHINATYRLEAGGRAFLLQRINGAVFPDPEGLMANLQRVTAHLRERVRDEGLPDPDRRVLALVPTREGGAFLRDEAGALWRCLPFIEGTRSLPRAETPEQVFQAARAFGRFLRWMEDLPAPPLRETIPGFQDTRRYLAALQRAAEADPCNRAREAAPELALAFARAELAALLPGLRERGELPLRPTHQDTKLDNVLMDVQSGEGLCVVDLDTVMPGLALVDAADLARSACAAAREDDPQPRVEPVLLAALVRGFDKGMGGLSARERRLLPEATRALAHGLAMRFLADHLEGDRYFRIHRPGQNLARARAQLALLRALESAEQELLAATC